MLTQLKFAEKKTALPLLRGIKVATFLARESLTAPPRILFQTTHNYQHANESGLQTTHNYPQAFYR